MHTAAGQLAHTLCLEVQLKGNAREWTLLFGHTGEGGSGSCVRHPGVPAPRLYGRPGTAREWTLRLRAPLPHTFSRY